MRKAKHTIDFLFPIALFFVFACSALFVLLFSANVYEKVVASSNANFETGTSLAYISEKIRQSDANGNISISEYDGYQALTIKETYNGQTYTTYIYEMDGYLKELFIKDGVSAPAQTGTTIMETHDFTMQELENGLFHFTCTTSDGSSDSITIGGYSHAAESQSF